MEATAEIARACRSCPDSVAWLHSVRKPVLMKTDRAKTLLKWRPQHTARKTLDEMVEAQREKSLSEPASRHGSRGREPRLARAPPVQLGVVLLAHLARVQQRRAVPHRALHERRDAVLGHADLDRRVGSPSRAIRSVR